MKKILAVLSISGALFCLLNALGIDTFCTTSGCAMAGEYEVMGISLYWFGFLGFLVFSGLLFFGNSLILLAYISFVLFVDAILLIVLAFISPCLSCMVVGLFFALLWMGTVYYAEFSRSVKAGLTPIMLIWFMFFSGNTINIAGEFMGPVPVYGEKNADIHVFFSPSCPACKEMVAEVVESSKESLALYPVKIAPEDIKGVCAFKCVYGDSNDIGQALNACYSMDCEEDTSFFANLRLQFITWRNQSFLANMGQKSVPVMVTNQMVVKKEKKPSLEDIFSKENKAKGCGFGKTKEENNCSL